jgi:DNA-binding MarR family transcriptional regulator
MDQSQREREIELSNAGEPPERSADLEISNLPPSPGSVENQSAPEAADPAETSDSTGERGNPWALRRTPVTHRAIDKHGDRCPRLGLYRSPSARRETDGLLVQLSRTANLARTFVESAVLTTEGMTWPMFDVLTMLGRHGDSCAESIAAITGTNGHLLTGTIRALTSAGLIEPVSIAPDQRSHLRLSVNGELLLPYLRLRVEAVETDLIGTSGPGCLLRRVTARLSERP